MRSTAFFDSLAAQFHAMKNGLAYVLFDSGALAKYNALSKRDLARFAVL